MLLLIVYLQSRLQSRLQTEDRGATAVEYGLLIAGIAAVVMVAVFLLGPAIAALFTSVTTQLGTPPRKQTRSAPTPESGPAPYFGKGAV